ncbi:7145_t:CDS:2, partial [Cetraspora pellucida]
AGNGLLGGTLLLFGVEPPLLPPETNFFNSAKYSLPSSRVYCQVEGSSWDESGEELLGLLELPSPFCLHSEQTLTLLPSFSVVVRPFCHSSHLAISPHFFWHLSHSVYSKAQSLQKFDDYLTPDENKKLEQIINLLKSHKDPYKKKLELFNLLKKLEVGEIEPSEEKRTNILLQGKIYNELAKQSLRDYKKLTVEEFGKNVETNKEDCFYNNYRIKYIPNLAGKLNLIESDKHPNFLQSPFKQDVANIDAKLLQEETTIQLRRGLEKDVEKTEKKFAKKKIKLVERAEYLISLRKQKIFSQKQIAFAHNKSTRTIRRWENPPLTFKKTGRKQKIVTYDLLLLIHHIYNYSLVFQQERSDYILEKTGHRYSQQVISLALKRLGLPRKVVPNLPPHRLLSLDETGFSLNMVPRFGYAPIGQRVQAYKPGRAKNYSLISLIHNTEKNGIVHCEIVEGAVDTEIFYNFISNVKLPTNEKYYLIMDNIRFHKNERIRELLKQKNIVPIYIVPYFPQLNPTEEFFNTVKQYAKKWRPRSEEELISILTEKITELQEEDMTKYFKNCLNFKID